MSVVSDPVFWLCVQIACILSHGVKSSSPKNSGSLYVVAGNGITIQRARHILRTQRRAIVYRCHTQG
eukprot:m.1053667 g.1053667  ORF g.1053667 m.1053667 type:complete len:67 (+) comp24187_c1_seq24:75-275(+)